jgi:hypothetical protein
LLIISVEDSLSRPAAVRWKQPQRFVIDYQLPLARGRVVFHLVGTIAKAGVDTRSKRSKGSTK